jgi:lysyl-tRNA synthetase class 2
LLAAVQEETGVGFLEIETDDEARRRARSLGCEIYRHETWGRCLTSVFLSKVVPKLTTPVHHEPPQGNFTIGGYDEHDSRLAECFATYINGQLICSGSTLLNDPFEYRERISAAQGRAEDGEAWGKKDHEEFAVVFELGMPPAAVMRAAIGRLVLQFVDHRAEERAA